METVSPTKESEELCYVNQLMDFLDENKYAIAAACATGLAVAIGAALYRYWVAGGRCHSNADIQGKTIIVTGANAGIGKETARDLARRGARVIMACRNVEAAKSAASDIQKGNIKGTVCVKKLDLSSFESVRNFASEILKTEERIDILINNAALMVPKQTTKDGFDMVFQSNYLGHFLLTRLLLDRLKESSPSRIIILSSKSHETGEFNWDDLNMEQPQNYGPYKAYCQSKLANMLFNLELSDRLKGFGVTTYAVHPGFVKTAFLRHAPKWITMPFSPIHVLLAKTCTQGAQTTIYCAIDEKLINESGKYYQDCKEQIPAEKAMDKQSATRLWKESMKMVGLEENDQE